MPSSSKKPSTVKTITRSTSRRASKACKKHNQTPAPSVPPARVPPAPTAKAPPAPPAKAHNAPTPATLAPTNSNVAPTIMVTTPPAPKPVVNPYVTRKNNLASEPSSKGTKTSTEPIAKNNSNTATITANVTTRNPSIEQDNITFTREINTDSNQVNSAPSPELFPPAPNNCKEGDVFHNDTEDGDDAENEPASAPTQEPTAIQQVHFEDKDYYELFSSESEDKDDKPIKFQITANPTKDLTDCLA